MNTLRFANIAHPLGEGSPRLNGTTCSQSPSVKSREPHSPERSHSPRAGLYGNTPPTSVFLSPRLIEHFANNSDADQDKTFRSQNQPNCTRRPLALRLHSFLGASSNQTLNTSSPVGWNHPLNEQNSDTATSSTTKHEPRRTRTSQATTSLSVDIPKLSFRDLDERTSSRRKQRASTENPFGDDLDAAKKLLLKDGIDLRRLTAAFQSLDEEGTGHLDLTRFRSLWKMVFPQRPLDEQAWCYTERIFVEMDEDASGEVSWDEILAYLNKSRRIVHARKPPTSWTDTLFRYVSHGDAVYDDRSRHPTFILLYKFFSQSVVILSIVILMVESLPSMQPRDHDDAPGTQATFITETCCVVFFTLEFVAWTFSYPKKREFIDPQGVLHIIPKDEDRPGDQKEKLKKVKWKYFFRESATWVDLLSILPYYLILIVGSELKEFSPLVAVRMLRLLRLLRIIRILRLGRSTSSGNAPELGAALTKSTMSLVFLVLLISISCAVAATFEFYAELDQASYNSSLEKWVRDADSAYADAGDVIAFQSIPDSLWWAIVTLTTVGYGDFFPTTIGGKVVASFAMFAGLIVVGFPITVLTGTFQMMELERSMREEELERCREFYFGIREWVQSSADSEIDAMSPRDVKNRRKSSVAARVAFCNAPTESPKGSPSPKAKDLSPASVKDKQLVSLLHSMELRIAERLMKLEARLSKFDDFALSDSESDSDSGSCSTSDSNKSSVELCHTKQSDIPLHATQSTTLKSATIPNMQTNCPYGGGNGPRDFRRSLSSERTAGVPNILIPPLIVTRPPSEPESARSDCLLDVQETRRETE